MVVPEESFPAQAAVFPISVVLDTADFPVAAKTAFVASNRQPYRGKPARTPV
jgi:hypothetical protein